MVRHDYIADDYEPITFSNLLENLQEEVAATGFGEPKLAMVTTAVEEWRCSWP